MTLVLPPRLLAAVGRDLGSTAWLDGLPRLVEQVCGEWQLVVEGPPSSGGGALVLPVRTAAGEAAALKLGRPRPESEHEHLALRAWDGDATVRLLRADPRRRLLLTERAEPGHRLEVVPVDEACEVVGRLYARLHGAPLPQLPRLSVRAAGWAVELAALRGTSLAPRRFVDQAVGLAGDFATDPGTDRVLLHGDLHSAQVLASGREPWLVVSPKPVTGDPAYEVAPMLVHRWSEAVATGDLRAALVERLYLLVDAADLDEQRVRDWVTVRLMVQLAAAVRRSSPDLDGVTRFLAVIKAVQR